MATNLYNTCTNPISGETFKTVSYDDQAFIMQWIVQPKGYVPFEHIHLHQDEIFHVQSGELNIVMDGKEHVAKAGQTLIVPKGVAHIAYNHTDAVLNCLVEYRPGLDQALFMQCYFGLINDGFVDKKGGVSVPKMGYFLTRMQAKSLARPTSIPSLVFRTALKVFYLQGRLSSWGKLYKKYIEE